MKLLNNTKKISMLAISATALSLSNVESIHAQVMQGKITENLNLRIGPSNSDPIILTMKKGSTVEILNYSEGWAYIRYNNKLGYASKQYISSISSNPTISGSGGNQSSNGTKFMECNVDLLNIRKGPSTSEQVIGSLKKGSKVEVVYHTSRGWSRIKYSNSYGYVSTTYLSDIKQNTQLDKYLTMECSTDKLNIRKGPSTKEPIIGSLKRGDKIDVIVNLEHNWSKVRFNNGYAYVSTIYLSNPSSNNTSNNTIVMKCNTTRLNVRSGPSTNNSVIGNLKKGDTIEIIYRVDNDWFKIKYNNGYAYINSKYVS